MEVGTGRQAYHLHGRLQHRTDAPGGQQATADRSLPREANQTGPHPPACRWLFRPVLCAGGKANRPSANLQTSGYRRGAEGVLHRLPGECRRQSPFSAQGRKEAQEIASARLQEAKEEQESREGQAEAFQSVSEGAEAA